MIARHIHDERAIAVFRVAIGLMIAWHGLELFFPEKMELYFGWEKIQLLPFGRYLAYAGKAIEFFCGIFLALGFFTRISASLLFLVFLIITLYVGSARFWMEDQLPFLLAIIALLFDFIGGGKFSIDYWMKGSNRHETERAH